MGDQHYCYMNDENNINKRLVGHGTSAILGVCCDFFLQVDLPVHVYCLLVVSLIRVPFASFGGGGGGGTLGGCILIGRGINGEQRQVKTSNTVLTTVDICTRHLSVPVFMVLAREGCTLWVMFDSLWVLQPTSTRLSTCTTTSAPKHASTTHCCNHLCDYHNMLQQSSKHHRKYYNDCIVPSGDHILTTPWSPLGQISSSVTKTFTGCH